LYFNNYKVVNLLKDSTIKLLESWVKNQETGELFDLKGKAIINATGVFTNAIMKLNDTVYKKIHCTKSRNSPCFDKSFYLVITHDDSENK
jgi:glycerol-3-phosphate dehydrogenase